MATMNPTQPTTPHTLATARSIVDGYVAWTWQVHHLREETGRTLRAARTAGERNRARLGLADLKAQADARRAAYIGAKAILGPA